MKVLVTGGGGFLGGAIVDQLLARGEAVRSFSRGQYPELAAKGVETVQGDLADPEAVRKAVAGCEVVFHTAAKPGMWGSYESYYRPNVLGTRNVIAACKTEGVPRLVHTSSPSVAHGAGSIEGADESIGIPNSFDAHYPATKAEAEREVLAANGEELKTVALRPHLLWGPGDNHLLPRIVDRAKSGRLRFVGRPSPKVDSTWIGDGAWAHLLAEEELRGQARCAGKAYFVSQGEPWPSDQLINGMLEAAGLEPLDKRIPAGLAWTIGLLCEGVYGALGIQSEPPMTRFLARQLSTAHWYDIGAAARDFGYVPRTSIGEGLAKLREGLATEPG